MSEPTESLELSVTLPAPPERVYRAWLDSGEHGAFTRAPAVIEPVVYGRFSAHDGYIEGITLELDANRRIVQTWRTSQFPKNSMDSRLELVLTAEKGGTRLTLKHTDIPAGQGAMYESGWREHYLQPIKTYFAKRSLAVVPAARPAKAKPEKAARKKTAAPKGGKKLTANAKRRPPAKTKAPAKSAKKAPAKKKAAAKGAKKAPAKSAKKAPAKKKAAAKGAKKKR